MSVVEPPCKDNAAFIADWTSLSHINPCSSWDAGIVANRYLSKKDGSLSVRAHRKVFHIEAGSDWLANVIPEYLAYLQCLLCPRGWGVTSREVIYKDLVSMEALVYSRQQWKSIAWPPWPGRLINAMLKATILSAWILAGCSMIPAGLSKGRISFQMYLSAVTAHPFLLDSFMWTANPAKGMMRRIVDQNLCLYNEFTNDMESVEDDHIYGHSPRSWVDEWDPGKGMTYSYIRNLMNW